MKKLLPLIFILSLLISCGNDKEDFLSKRDGQIAFKFNANATPSGTNNLIGVQIYKGVKASTTSGSLVQYSPYAYGLFDDISKIKIDLPKDVEYKIVSTIVVDGKAKVAQDNNGYLKPFLSARVGTPLTNSFKLDSSKAMIELNQSTTTMSAGGTRSVDETEDYTMPPLDRWYGEVVNYEGDSNENPIVYMDRYVFGLRVNVEFVGDQIQDSDFFKLIVDGARDTLIFTPKDEIKTVEVLYTYSTLSKEETPPSIQMRAFTNNIDGDYWEFAINKMESLYRNDLMILNQTIQKDMERWINLQKWDGISGFYGDRGYD